MDYKRLTEIDEDIWRLSFISNIIKNASRVDISFVETWYQVMTKEARIWRDSKKQTVHFNSYIPRMKSIKEWVRKEIEYEIWCLKKEKNNILNKKRFQFRL
jgi:Zn-dependent M32 family carboxypeptidase